MKNSKIFKGVVWLVIAVLLGNMLLPLKKSRASTTSFTDSLTANPGKILKVYAEIINDASLESTWVRENTIDVSSLGKKYKLISNVTNDKDSQLNGLDDGKLDSVDASAELAIIEKFVNGEETDPYNTFSTWVETAIGTIKSATFTVTCNGHTGEGTLDKSLMKAEGVTDSNAKTIAGVKALATKFGISDDSIKNSSDYEIAEQKLFEAIDDANGTVELVFTTTDDVNWWFTFGHDSSNKFYAYLISEEDETPTATPTPTPTATATPTKDTTFTTTISYESKVGTKDVSGTLTNGTWIPNYDTSNPKKDADVTAIITATSDGDTITKINGEAISTDSSTGTWYYLDSNDKTKVAKVYPFESYKEKNGIATEGPLTITGSDGNTSSQTVSIKWPFRIIDKTYSPENPTKDDKTVTVTITTNLPIDETKIPTGWTLNPDNNCQIYKVYNRDDGNIDEEVIIYQKGSDDSDSTNVKITWPSEDDGDEYKTDIDYTAVVGTKNVGGKTEGGTYYPNYDESNPKEDATVTAIITTTTEGATIGAVNGVEMKETGANSEGWYYVDSTDKSKIAKDYAFDDYDNSTANGIVEEVTITEKGNSTATDKQTVSIKYPFRIIDHTYEPDGDNIIETIETNLPMDADKIPTDAGWKIVEGSDNHKISRVIKKGEDVNEITTVYQNGTGDKATIDSQKTWPTDNGAATTTLPKTGDSTILIVLAIVGIFAVIRRKKIRNIFSKK